MNERIKILFFNKDVAGVGYWRTLTPAMQLDMDHSDKFQVEINPDINFDDYEGTLAYFKEFQIIHYHRFIFPDINRTVQIARELKKNGTVLIMDIDDYWLLDKTHPMYATAMEKQLHFDIIDNLKIADYVTTTTEVFAAEIRQKTGKDNVMVFPNSVNSEWMRQFQPNKKADEKFTRITYMAGSSHKHDIQQLEGVTNMLNGTEDIKDKFKFILAGWDTEGNTTEYRFNQEFAQALQKRRLWDQKMIKSINRSRGNVDLIERLPVDLKNKFRNNVFDVNQRSINSIESIYLDYERILTDGHKIIKNQDYLKWLEKFERDKYVDAANVNYERRWTQKANIYATVLDETEVSLAPLADHKFNRMKSNLKQVEVWTRKLPIICSDIPPYNVDGKHMKNCILVPVTKHNDKHWYKAMKKLITEPNLREDLGNQLYEDFKVKYHLKHVTDARAQFYSTVATIYHVV
jgi:glycosyltransferase involved in cell wall biosynthesis